MSSIPSEIYDFGNAARGSDIEEVQKYLTKGGNIDVEVDRVKSTALHYAASSGKKDMVEFLILNGADVTKCTRAGFTALHCAAMYGFPEIVKLLLTQGNGKAKINEKADSKTSLFLAISHRPRQNEIVSLLLEHKADPSLTNNAGFTPYRWALFGCCRNLADLLEPHEIKVSASKRIPELS